MFDTTGSTGEESGCEQEADWLGCVSSVGGTLVTLCVLVEFTLLTRPRGVFMTATEQVNVRCG